MIVDRIIQGFEQRATSTLREPADWLWDAFGGTPTFTGKRVTVETALALIPVYAAVRALAESVGSLPLTVYRELDRGREKARDSRLWYLLHEEPNPEMAAHEVWENITGHLNLWGNGFLYKARNGAGQVVELWPLPPDRIKVGRVEGQRIFEITQEDNSVVVGNERDILHIRAFGTDGLVGLSPITQARQGLAVVMAQEEFQGRFYANNANPGGFLAAPGTLGDDASKRLKANWEASHKGLENVAKVAVLEEGITWQQTGLPFEDQQFVETQKMGIAQVARLFRVPPSKINAESGGSLTYSTTELENLAFVTDSLRPWLIRIERALKRDGDIRIEKDLYPEFLVDALLRGDIKTRYQAHAIAIASGFKNRNEVRVEENLTWVDGLDTFELSLPKAALPPAEPTKQED